jgi:hypothetical protein
MMVMLICITKQIVKPTTQTNRYENNNNRKSINFPNK